MKKCLVIGAGLSGLVAARELKKNGWQTTILDKARGVGGRLATRRLEDAVFDHGAQFFTVRDPKFAALVEQWQNDGAAQEWFRGLPAPGNPKPDDDYPRFRGAPGMTALAKWLARDLEIELSQTVREITRENGWNVRTETTQFAGDALILTPPVPQSLALLKTSGAVLPDAVRETLEAIQYEPCFALMALLVGPSRVPSPGAVSLQDGPIWWIADNFQKGVSPRAGAVTIHATGDWTREHFEEKPEIVANLLLEAARDYLGAEIESWQLHRWRYSKPEKPLEIGALAVPEWDLVFAGDAFCGAKIEGAALSGLAAAQQLQPANNR